MLKNILVPLDGSPLGEAALPYAKAIASRTAASLTLVRAAHYSSLLGDVAGDQLRAVTEAEEYLRRLAAELDVAGFTVETGVPFGGSAAQWIIEESDIRHADLIVMATHDRVGPDRWAHGSVAESVVHSATMPVMLVRGAEAGQLSRSFEGEQPTLVVPLDGSELAEAALPVASELAQAFGARVVLVAVLPKPGQLVAGQAGAIVTYTGAEHATLEAETRAYLEATVGRTGASGTNVEVRFGDPTAEIAAAAQSHAAAAVVMATHGRTGLVRSILGSVAGGVLHHSRSPVVLVRPSELRGAEQPVLTQQAAASAD